MGRGGGGLGVNGDWETTLSLPPPPLASPWHHAEPEVPSKPITPPLFLQKKKRLALESPST